MNWLSLLWHGIACMQDWVSDRQRLGKDWAMADVSARVLGRRANVLPPTVIRQATSQPAVRPKMGKVAHRGAGIPFLYVPCHEA